MQLIKIQKNDLAQSSGSILEQQKCQNQINWVILEAKPTFIVNLVILEMLTHARPWVLA